MVEHDGHVGQLLKKLDDLGVADNTIVIYTSDNGAEMMSWPDGGSTPYRGEKAQNWEGGYRVPTLIRWPGVIKPGTIFNQFFAHEDFLPTFAAAAGNPNIVEQCLKSCDLRGQSSFHVHLDGYNLMPFFKGEVNELTSQRLPLLERRRRSLRHPCPRLEDLLYRVLLDGHRHLAGSIHQTPRSHDLQPAFRSVRKRTQSPPGTTTGWLTARS